MYAQSDSYSEVPPVARTNNEGKWQLISLPGIKIDQKGTSGSDMFIENVLHIDGSCLIQRHVTISSENTVQLVCGCNWGKCMLQYQLLICLHTIAKLSQALTPALLAGLVSLDFT